MAQIDNKPKQIILLNEKGDTTNSTEIHDFLPRIYDYTFAKLNSCKTDSKRALEFFQYMKLRRKGCSIELNNSPITFLELTIGGNIIAALSLGSIFY